MVAMTFEKIERCQLCGANLALVGHVHRCIPRAIEELPPQRKAKVVARGEKLITAEKARVKDKSKPKPAKRRKRT